MSSLYGRYFYKPTDSFQLGFFRLVYCTSIAAVHLAGVLAYIKWSSLELNRYFFIAIFYGLTLILSGIGLFTRTMLALSIVGCFLYEYSNAPYFRHTTPVVFFTLIALAVSPGISRLSLDQFFSRRKDHTLPTTIDSWPIQAIQLVIALAFLSGFFAKIMTHGMDWISGESLRQTLLGRYIINENHLALLIASKPWLCQLLSLFTLILEAGFFLVIFFPGLSLFFVPLGLLFHLAVQLTMDINFFYYYAHSYLIFINWVAVRNYFLNLKSLAFKKKYHN